MLIVPCFINKTGDDMSVEAFSINSRLQKILQDNAGQASTIHNYFLQTRHSSLEQMGALLEFQIKATTGKPISFTEEPKTRPAPLFDIHQLQEFATGSMARCFGPEFLVLEGRRYPRIPNGDLMLMSRILEISGKRHHFDQPASIVAEYDVPLDAWYFQNQEYPRIPYSLWMEIALQPCGFLSAYLGTSLMSPAIDFYFRNLDGSARLVEDIEVRGKTITTHARLLSTVASSGTIIQKFDFLLFCDGHEVFQGESIFGFFTPEGMAKQVGLDGGKLGLPVYEKAGDIGLVGEWIELNDPNTYLRFFTPSAEKAAYHLPGGQLNFLDRVFIAEKDVNFPHGYLFAIKENDPLAWFYPCHFYMDPVMPGSLGVEAILEAIQIFALKNDLGRQFHSPHFKVAVNHQLIWKYRGQILPTHKQMKLEVKITRIEQTREQVIIVGDASLWADSVRIYEVKHATVCLVEGLS
jgi:3-hydroxymyristoyl/3-hydroxydecanoyl-(acyl carrier protein) dehydratase